MDQNHVSLKTRLAYSFGDVFSGGSFLIINLMFLKFLTDYAGLQSILAGAVFALGKIWDALTDPLMGFLSDRTRSRFGRRRVYFLIGILPIFFSFSMLWASGAAHTQTGMFLYYLFAYVFFSTAYTLVNVPYTALLPELTPSYQERASLAGLRLIFSAVSAIMAGVLPSIIISKFPQAATTGYMVMGLCFGLFYALPWIFVFLGTHERFAYKAAEQKQERISQIFIQMLGALRNRSFRYQAAIFISGQAAVDILSMTFAYYLGYVLVRGGEFSAIMGTLLVVPLFMLPLYIAVSRKFQKTTPMHFGLVIWMIALSFFFFLQKGQPGYILYILVAVSGIGTSASVFVPLAILPEVMDTGELITSQRQEGIYGGFSTLLRKISQALAGGFVGIYLSLIGYVPNVTQTPGTILGLKALFSFLPLLLIALTLYFSFRYKITDPRHKILLAEIERLKSGGGKSQVALETKQVCELITGIPYEQLWDSRGTKKVVDGFFQRLGFKKAGS